MRAVVFGGSGFLGSHVADALTDAGHEVTIYDITPSPYLRKDQTMVVGDIMDQQLVEETTAAHDVVYHMAGIADIDECIYRPLDTVKFNIMGTVIILEASKKTGVKRFVFASSAYVYSAAGYFYRSSKQASEAFIENYNELFELPYTILRYGSLYGERADKNNSIFKILTQALSEGKITYRGTGDEFREFIHVKDAATNSVKILDPEFENKNVIITGVQQMKYRDLLDMIREMMGNKVEIEILPSERIAHYRLTPYNFAPKLGKKLVANPHIDIGQGLLALLAEIYERLHTEKHETMGFFVDESGK
jgi:UDP-glucose 4-epimerase